MLSEVKFQRMRGEAIIPTRAHPWDAGLDLYACVPTAWGVVPPRCRTSIPTGLIVDIPQGYVGLIHPRSGMAAKHGVTVLNAPGTIDAGYRGELMVLLVNHSNVEFPIKYGDRIAQLIIQKVELPTPVLADDLEEDTERGGGGFGSTGV